MQVGKSAELPGVVPVSIASALNSLPTPLIALLAALLALAVASGVVSLRKAASPHFACACAQANERAHDPA